MLLSGRVFGQTDFAPGQIMFTGYDSDDPDAFSIVLLTDVVSGTKIYITDRGWSSATGFRDDPDGEGTISFEFTANYTCGTTFIFTDVGGSNDWLATNAAGNSVGIVTILLSTTESPAQDVDGIEFNVGGFPFPDGDQLFIYQLPEPNPANQTAFVTGIHMNGGAWNGGNGDDYSSQQPTGLANNEVVRFNTEVDNAKYDCTPNAGLASFLQAAITNDNGAGGLKPDGTNNWNESNTYISLATACAFCCGATIPAPVIAAPFSVNTNQVFTITITGTLAPGENWELYTAGCGVGSPLQTTTSSTFSVTAPATEGFVTYYVRSSEDAVCGALCATVQVGVCINVNNMNVCTNCSANPQTCGDCYMPGPANNPDLDSGCYNQKLIFILDESGSIGANEPDVKAGVLAFLNAINGQGIEVALIEFSDYGRVVNDYIPISNAYIINVQNYFDNIPFPGSGHWYQPGGGTNWHDAMLKADAMTPSDIIMFFTDGEPTGWTNNGIVDYCGNGGTTQTPEIVNPVKLANKLKGENTHMFMLGVGNGIVDYNLQLMSGFTEYDSTINTIGTSDYSIGNFVDLAENLAVFISELCLTPLELDKQLYGAVCGGVQQFRFIIHNPGTESAATIVQVIDTFPSGYTNITYNGPPGVKLCIGPMCTAQGQPQPDNAFIWTTNSLPPGESDTLILSATVLPTGIYTNIGWALGSNTALVSDTVTSPNFVDDLDPVITCPPNLTILCTASTMPVNTGLATAFDPDGTSPAVTYIDVNVVGSCPQLYTINRTWTATDGCFNTDDCLQNIIVETAAPVIGCAVTRNVVGCNTSAITLPSFSTTTATSSVSVFENATNQGNIAIECGISLVTYIDVASGTCPIVVTRTWSVTSSCDNSSTCIQIINVDDNINPAITTCAVTRNIVGCNTSAITGPVFSTVMVASTEAVFENGTNQGNTSDACGITSVTYIDVAVGTCPTVVTRKWTVSDVCSNTTTCNQIINVNDTGNPTITTCAVTRTIEGCTTAAITGPPFSTTSATSSEAVFENAPNLGNTSDACGIAVVTYIDVVTGTCPKVVTRTWTVSDACGHTASCNQTINVTDTGIPTITSCAVTRNIEGCNTSAITGPAFSATTATSSEAVFENGTNQGNASDVCGLTFVTYIDVASGSCPTVVTRTWTVKDACNNAATCNQTINVAVTAPTITTCAVTRNIEGCTTSAITGPAYSTTSAASSEAEFENATNQGNSSSACGITGVTYIDAATGTCPTIVTRTWTVTNECGNSSSCNQTINVDDTIVPGITACAVTRNIEGCNTSAITGPGYSATTATSSEAVFENATNQGATSDVCGITGVTYIDVAVGTCPSVVTRKWTVTDACGNTSTCNQTINVDDTVVPSISTCPVTRNFEGCGTSAITGPVFSAVSASSTLTQFQNANNQGSASDVCGITSVNYIDVAAGTCPTVVTRTWTVSDVCGNSATCNQTINVDDTAAPTVTVCAVTRNIEGCSTSAITSPAFSVTTLASSEVVFENGTNQGDISDACGITSVTYIDVAAGTCPTVVTRTWTLSDICGNTSTCNQIINVDDNVVPAIATCAVTRNIEGCTTSVITDPVFSTITLASSEVVFENATNLGNTSDACGITSVTYIDVAASSCPTVVTRKWTISDGCGNTSTCNQIINVDDSVVPSISVCAVTRNIEGCNTTAITGPGYSATTAASSEAVFENATNQGATSDVCGITVVTYIDVAVGTCPTVVTRKWTVSDACGNTSTCNQTINVDDTVLPVISACAVTRNFEGCSTSAITGPIFSAVMASSTQMQFQNGNNQGSVSDACGITSVTYIDVPTGTCPIVVTRTWTISDACGNSSTCNQTINVNDTTNPTITICAVTRNIEGCNTSVITSPAYSTTLAASSEAVFENVPNLGSTSDACGLTTVQYIDVSAGTCPTVVTRTWTVTDACGHTATCNQTINVNDTTNPAVTSCAVTRNIEGCTTSAITGPVYSTTTTASTETVFENATNLGNTSDACGIVSVSYIDVSASTCPIVVTRTWTISDACGHATTCNQIINVDDAIVPSISVCAATRNIEGCNTSAITDPVYSVTSAASSEAVFENATNQGTTSDVCGITGVTYIDVAVGTCPTVVTRKWTVSDACGNTSTCNQIINVDDSVVPGITVCAVTRTIEGCNTSAIIGPAFSATTATSSEAVFENATNQAVSSDVCGITSVTYIDVAAGTCTTVVTRTWTVSDACGNTSTCNQTINVNDTTNPTITSCAVTRTIEGCTTSAITGPSYSTTLATSSEVVFENGTNLGNTSDVCGLTSVQYIDVSAGTCPTVVTRTWTVTDACGHTATCNQTINVNDTTNPTVTSCAVTRNIEGCTTSAITGPVYSATAAASSEAVFENATNLGNASDLCGITSVTYIDVSTGTCPIVVTRTWTVSDACAHTAICIQTINVDDTTAPTLSCPANITIQCTASTAPANTGSETVSDNCDASPSVMYIDITASSSCPQAYSITRTWTATDVCGNTSTCAQVISIVDTTPPVVVCPANITIQCTENSLPANTGMATSTDNCDAAPTLGYTDVTTAIPATHGYLIQRTWTTSDLCGNGSTCLQTIVVENPLDPDILGIPFDTICSGDLVVFEAVNQGINPMTYQWAFGSGSNPAAATGIGAHNIQYAYNGSNGTIGAWVLLTVSTPGCEAVTDTVANIHVNAIPNANITSPTGNPCVFALKTFQPQAVEMPGFSYTWNFGSGASIPTAMGYGPHTVEYITSGSKTVQLIVFSNEQGATCGDTSTLMFTVNTCPGIIRGKVLKPDGTPIASVNVRLYADQNLDGIQDNNTIIKTVFTNTSGDYQMASVTAGYYVIWQNQPVGYFSLYEEDIYEDFDSLSNLIPNDNIIPVTVEAMESDSGNYFYEVSSPGIISGYVFQDFDNNQFPASIEGLEGVTIQLHTDNDQNGVADQGGLVGTTTTSSLGYYTFGGYAIGSYVITEVQPANYTNVNDFDPSNDGDVVPNTNMTNDTIPLTLLNNETDADNFFIEFSPCSRIVTTVTDNVPGSLRYMIDCAGTGDTITFHPVLLNQTLHLTAGRIEIDKNLHILSSLNPRLMIQSDVNGAFKIMQDKTVEFKNLNITSGLSGYPGAAFDNYGVLTLWDVIVYRNTLLPATDYLIFNGVPGLFTVKGIIQIDTN